jgi:hypothetical protein
MGLGQSSIWAMSPTRPSIRRQVNSTTQTPGKHGRAENDPYRQKRQSRRGPLPKPGIHSLQLGAEGVARAEGGLPRFYNISFGYARQAVPPKPQAGNVYPP